MSAAVAIEVPHTPEGIVCEVLNWEEVARAVRPELRHPPPVPSPFPYLPSTPQELLCAYSEAVGVQPRDCYSAQATVNRPGALLQGGMFATNLGPKQPCADGKARMCSRSVQGVAVRPPIANLDDMDGIPRGLRTIARVADVVDRVWEADWAGEEIPPYRYCRPPVG